MAEATADRARKRERTLRRAIYKLSGCPECEMAWPNPPGTEGRMHHQKWCPLAEAVAESGAIDCEPPPRPATTGYICESCALSDRPASLVSVGGSRPRALCDECATREANRWLNGDLDGVKPTGPANLSRDNLYRVANGADVVADGTFAELAREVIRLRVLREGAFAAYWGWRCGEDVSGPMNALRALLDKEPSWR